MTIEIKRKATIGPLTVEQEFRWDALSSVSQFLFSPLALIARLGEAYRVDRENEREAIPHRPNKGSAGRKR